MHKMNSCFDYFSAIQQKMEHNSAQVIAYHMRKFKDRRA